MAYQVLARKWRPQRFDEIVGQKHIIRSLEKALQGQKVAHAYLFTGTRGVGKTSLARILAKSLRCSSPISDGNPCQRCDNCRSIDSDSSLDVVEIDGASHNGVDHMRALIENVYYLPSSGRYKVYIIDEVHMLSKEAFNALLKTLEAPPEFVVFIFATTLPDKLLDTVLSRCQRFDFREIRSTDLQEHLLTIAQREGIQFSSPELALQLAKEAKGSVRDALSLLDQVAIFSAGGPITEEALHLALGTVGQFKLWELTFFLCLGEPDKVSFIYRDILSQNINLKRFVLSLLDCFFDLINAPDFQSLLLQNAMKDLPHKESLLGGRAEIFWIYETLVKDLQWALDSLIPEKVVEVVLQKVAFRKSFFGKGQETKKTVTPPPVRPPQPPSPKPVEQAQPITKNWDEFVDFVYQRYPTLAANLEHGNILQPMVLQSNAALKVNLCFATQAKIFYDLLTPSEQRVKIVKALAEFFAISEQRIDLSLQLLNEKEKDQLHFQGQVEKERLQKADQLRQQEQAFVNEDIIQEAQKLFNSKIEQVKIYQK